MNVQSRVRNFDATLHVLYVVDVTAPTLNVRGSDSSFDQLEIEGEEMVNGVVKVAEQTGIETVTGTVVRGIPYQAILDYADEHGIDLIVMGTHGRSGLDRHLLGSVTEKVIRQSNMSVLTVRLSEERVR